jgi:hypothetical protein
MTQQKMEMQYTVGTDGKVISEVISRGTVDCKESVKIGQSIGRITKDEELPDNGCSATTPVVTESITST